MAKMASMVIDRDPRVRTLDPEASTDAETIGSPASPSGSRPIGDDTRPGLKCLGSSSWLKDRNAEKSLSLTYAGQTPYRGRRWWLVMTYGVSPYPPGIYMVLTEDLPLYTGVHPFFSWADAWYSKGYLGIHLALAEDLSHFRATPSSLEV